MTTIFPGKIRIIAGKWRSKKIPVPESLTVRPTSDRIRETLFNWLQPYIFGANCLDLFAGTGILGLEALSRGANSVTWVDSHPQVITHLGTIKRTMGLANVKICALEVPVKLPVSNTPYDIVFLDPPFKTDLLSKSILLLEEQNILSDTAYVYLESDSDLRELTLPSNWKLLKCKRAGHVNFGLAIRKRIDNDY